MSVDTPIICPSQIEVIAVVLLIGLIIFLTSTAIDAHALLTTERMSGMLNCSDVFGTFRGDIRGTRTATIENCTQINATHARCYANHVSDSCCHFDAIPKCLPAPCDAYIESFYVICKIEVSK